MKKSLGTYFEHCPAYRKNGNTALSTVRWYPKISKDFSEKEKIVRGSAPHFSKISLCCELSHFEFCRLRRLFMFALSKGPKKSPCFMHRLFSSNIFFQGLILAKNFSLLTAKHKTSQGQGSSWIRKMLHMDPDSIEKAYWPAQARLASK